MLLTRKLFKTSSYTTEISNIILFSIAGCISLFGTSIYNFAIGLYVLKITGSGLSFATTLILSILAPVIINPFAGVLADKIDKKLVAIVTDMLNGLLLIGLYLITTRYYLSLSMIYITTFLLNVFTTVYGISIEAAKPNLVSEKKLISMNSINKIMDCSSSILGPMVGGLVFAFLDIKIFIIINGVSFIISAMLEKFIDFKFNYKDIVNIKEKINFLNSIKDGAAYIKNRKDLLNIFSIFIALNFFIGLSLNVPMPYIINNVLKLSAKNYGIINAAFPVGMILGALRINKIIEKYSYGKIMKYTNILLSFCMAAIGLSVILHYKTNNETVYLIYFILIMTIAGITLSLIDIPIFYILQSAVPDEFRGRVLSLGISISKIVLPIALMIAGVLINHTPAYLLPIISGILLCIFSIFFIKID